LLDIIPKLSSIHSLATSDIDIQPCSIITAQPTGRTCLHQAFQICCLCEEAHVFEEAVVEGTDVVLLVLMHSNPKMPISNPQILMRQYRV
jgi:hypothetical protein